MGLLNHGPAQRAVDEIGQPIAGARRWVFLNASEKLARLYSDRNLTYTVANPMRANGEGYFEECHLPKGAYRVMIEGPLGEILIDDTGVEVAEELGGSVIVTNEGGGTVAFSSVAALLADTALSYTPSTEEIGVVVGDVIEVPSEGYRYKVAAASETTHQIETAGVTPVKFFALPDQSGVITTDQLGWNGTDVFDHVYMARALHALQNGGTLEFTDLVTFERMSRTLPENVTFRARRPRVDGIRLTDSSWALTGKAMLSLNHGVTLNGLRFTVETVTTPHNGRYIDVNPSLDPENNPVTRVTIDNCTFEGDVVTKITVINAHDFTYRNCYSEFGTTQIRLIEGERIRILDSYFHQGRNGVSEQIKTLVGANKVAPRHVLLQGNTFFEPPRDGLDTTGGLEDTIIRHNVFIRGGHSLTDLGGSGVGFGGIDLKVAQSDAADPGPVCKRVTIEGNYFEDSYVGLVTAFSGDFATPTDQQILEYGVSEIFFRGNIFRVVEGGLKCGVGGGGGIVEMDGDTFMNGAIPFMGGCVSFNASGLTYEMVSGQSLAVSKNTRGSYHFKEIRAIGGMSTIVLPASTNVTFSGRILTDQDGQFFRIENSSPDATDNLRFSFEGVYTGSGTGPVLAAFQNDGGLTHGSITFEKCCLTGWEHLVESGFGTPAIERILIKDCDWLHGTDAMVKWGSGSTHRMNAIDAIVRGCTSNGGTLQTGYSGGVTRLDIRDNTGFGAQLTVAGGTVSVFADVHSLDTENDAASDDLVNIAGGVTGQTVTLVAEDPARIVTVKTGIGNVVLPSDRALDTTQAMLVVRKHADGNWHEVAFA